MNDAGRDGRPDALRTVVGAHPDDCDLEADGVACKYADRGHDVCLVP